MIEIKNMRPCDHGRIQAQYDVAVEGYLIRGCVIIKRRDGALSALTPLLRDNVRSVDIPERHWFEFIERSLAAYRDWCDWGRPGVEAVDDGGLREEVARACG